MSMILLSGWIQILISLFKISSAPFMYKLDGFSDFYVSLSPTLYPFTVYTKEERLEMEWSGFLPTFTARFLTHHQLLTYPRLNDPL